MSGNYGTDPAGRNLGGNILASYLDPENEFGNSTGQGVGNDLTFIDLTLSYRLKHNLFIDLKHIYRDLTSDDPAITCPLSLLQWH